MKRLLIVLALLLVPCAAQAANCVAIVYEDLTFRIVPWDRTEDLSSSRRYLVIRVQHVQGSFTNEIQLGNGNVVWIKNTADGDLIVGEIFASPNSAKQHVFKVDGTQDLNVVIPADISQASGGGAKSSFVVFPFMDPDYDQKVIDALAIDIGTCTP